MRIKALLALGALLSALTFAGTAGAQTAAPTTAPYQLRGERGSARNLLRVRRHLEAMIDQLQRDQHDYGGYRVKAIADLQASRADIQAAVNWDATHPH